MFSQNRLLYTFGNWFEGRVLSITFNIFIFYRLKGRQFFSPIYMFIASKLRCRRLSSILPRRRTFKVLYIPAKALQIFHEKLMSSKKIQWKKCPFFSVIITCHVPANIYRTVLHINMHRKRFESRPVVALILNRIILLINVIGFNLTSSFENQPYKHTYFACFHQSYYLVWILVIG